MKYDEETQRFQLSTGRTFLPGANRAIGLTAWDGEYDITVGYDSPLHLEDTDKPALTTAEQIEIAEYVISQWTDYLVALRRGEKP